MTARTADRIARVAHESQNLSGAAFVAMVVLWWFGSVDPRLAGAVVAASGVVFFVAELVENRLAGNTAVVDED